METKPPPDWMQPARRTLTQRSIREIFGTYDDDVGDVYNGIVRGLGVDRSAIGFAIHNHLKRLHTKQGEPQ